MNKKSIVLLLLAMTQAGKTTKVGSLSQCPEKVAEVCASIDARTQTTVDWELNVECNDMKLVNVEINPKELYGNVYNHNTATYNEALKNAEYLNEYFGLEEKEDTVSSSELEQYVSEQIKHSIDKATFEYLKKIMLDKRTSKYVRRIKIHLPVCDEMKEFIIEKELTSLIIRDTRGIMDIEVDELKQLPNMSIYDLGLNGVDGVLLMCSSANFPNGVTEWYKNVYSQAFQSVPVFLETRHDSLLNIYQLIENISGTISVNQYLEKIKKGDQPFFKDIVSTHFSSGLELLKGFGVVREDYYREWHFKYKVYELKNSIYVTPLVATLSKAKKANEISFSNEDYQFFKTVNIENIRDIVEKIVEHKNLLDMIENSNVVNDNFRNYSKEKMAQKKVEMCPNYRYISREEVCTKILTDKDYLGPRNGITTTNHGTPRYLAALTSAVSSHAWLHSISFGFKITEKLRNNSGEEIAPEMSLNVQNDLVQMYIIKKILNSSDCYAYYRDYVITDRNITVDSIVKVSNMGNSNSTNSLDEVTATIVDEVFK